MDKTIKITILIIIILILGSVTFAVIYLREISQEIVNYDIQKSEVINLEKMSYEICHDGSYQIYDCFGEYITTVYTYDELKFYIDNPDFRLSYNNLDEEEINDESLSDGDI